MVMTNALKGHLPVRLFAVGKPDFRTPVLACQAIWDIFSETRPIVGPNDVIDYAPAQMSPVKSKNVKSRLTVGLAGHPVHVKNRELSTWSRASFERRPDADARRC